MASEGGGFEENYFEGEPIRRTEVEVRVGKLRNGKVVGKDGVTGEKITVRSYRVVDWICSMCNMAFESGVVPEDCMAVVIVPLYKGKRKRAKCRNYIGIIEKYMQGS